jgi:ribonucleoside-triphosphate reductase (thioredoxin)
MLNFPANQFRLSAKFMANFEEQQPSWGPLGYVTYKRTYARIIDEETGQTEEFWQTCRRVVEGVYNIQRAHCERLRLPWNARKSQRSAQQMFTRMWEFKFLPPGRGLWMMGTEYVWKCGSAALNNCAFVSTKQIDTDFSAPFTFLMDMSMLGVGVGGDTKGEGLVSIKTPKSTDAEWVIPDTREGWVESVKILIDAFVGKGSIPVFNYTKVRRYGTAIRGFGGTASGAGPLAELHMNIVKVLTNSESVLDNIACLLDLASEVSQATTPEEKELERCEPLILRISIPEFTPYDITSTQIVDIFNYIGKCVVAGNVRRTAEIMFGRPDDQSFSELKQDLDKLRDRRWASNNSIFAEVGMDYTKHAEMTAVNGEPGYMWLDNARAYGRMMEPANWKDRRAEGANPCSEQTLESFELCCLVETFPSNHESLEDYHATLKYAYLYAKSVTLLPTHDPRTNAVMMRNRRIGCSQSGIQHNIAKIGFREHMGWCDSGYARIKGLDKKYSDWLCVPRSIKMTSVKPSGTVSLLPGVSPGVHFDHSEYYIRRIRIQKSSPIIKACQDAGHNSAPCPYQPDSIAIDFPVHVENFVKSKYDASMWEQLELVAQIQRYWADNQVSATVTFSKEEAGQIATALSMYETRLKSVSFLPLDDHGYELAPYETITKEEYEALSAKLTPIDLSLSSHEKEDKFCDGDSCTVEF